MFPTLPRRPRGLHLAHHLGVPPLAHVGVALDHLEARPVARPLEQEQVYQRRLAKMAAGCAY